MLDSNGKPMEPGQEEYFRCLGVDPGGINISNKDRLKEAYTRAHEIRKFEIEMYWKRSAYLWTIQAAALAGLAVIATRANLAEWGTASSQEDHSSGVVSNQMNILILAGIWLFGMITSAVWLFLLKGAKFWQKNWERHVDILEDFFSGALYKTLPTNQNIAPFSVSRLNETMALATMLIWAALGAGGFYLLFPEVTLEHIVEALLAFAALVAIALVLQEGFRMDDFPGKNRRPVDRKPYAALKRPAPIFRRDNQ